MVIQTFIKDLSFLLKKVKKSIYIIVCIWYYNYIKTTNEEIKNGYIKL